MVFPHQEAFMDSVFFVRQELEARFPTLVFHFFKNVERIGMTVRIARRRATDELNTGGYAVIGGQMYEEEIESWVNFPDEVFLAKCMLIA